MYRTPAGGATIIQIRIIHKYINTQTPCSLCISSHRTHVHHLLNGTNIIAHRPRRLQL